MSGITNCTLVCIDCVDVERAIRSLDLSLARCHFDSVMLLTSLDTDYENAVKIPHLDSREEYSRFVIYDLSSYIETAYVLIVQHDGWIIDGAMWDESWKRYDYIGTVSALTDPGPGGKGGNGGFTFRSRRLLDAAPALVSPALGCGFDDVFLSSDTGCPKTNRRLAFEALGFKFAPRWVQQSFALNKQIYSGQFGHHKCTELDNPNGLKPLTDLYTLASAEPSDINQHLPRFVDMVKLLNAQHVIELGCGDGNSTVGWLHGLAQTGGKLTSIDLTAQPDLGPQDRWTFIQGNDLDPEVMAQVSPADILFIDTDHQYYHTLKELEIYSDSVRRGGIIVCHDTELENVPEEARLFPVAKACMDFAARRGLKVDFIPGNNGLGIIQL